MLMTSHQSSPVGTAQEILSDGSHPPSHCKIEWNSNNHDSQTITTSQQQAPVPAAAVGAGLLKTSEEQSPEATAQNFHDTETEHAFVMFTTDKND